MRKTMLQNLKKHKKEMYKFWKCYKLLNLKHDNVGLLAALHHWDATGTCRWVVSVEVPP